MAPSVSVVIPTFDRLSLLKHAVASVQTQTETDWELIVVDDGSSDGTVDWLKESRDSRIRAVLLEHTGLIAALRNAGAAVARAPWIAFLDSDDLWFPSKLERQLAELPAKGAEWSFTGYEIMDVAGRKTSHAEPPIADDSEDLLEGLLGTRTSAALSSLVVSSRMFHECGGFDEDPQLRLREDLDLVIRLATRGCAAIVTDCLVRIRDHDGRSTNDVSDPFALSAAPYHRFLTKGGAPRARRVARRVLVGHLRASASLAAERGQWSKAATRLLEAGATSLGLSPRPSQGPPGATHTGVDHPRGGREEAER